MGLESLLDEMLGYLNFSDGTPRPAFQRAVNEFYRQFSQDPEPWTSLWQALRERAESVEGQAAAFRDTTQARAALRLVFQEVLPGYRAHHSDLLGHCSESELLGPFLVARVFETTLAEQGPWEEVERIRQGALARLNDFIGYRPVAILENSRSVEPYDHERCRPIPLYLRDAGVAVGRYEGIVTATLELLQATDRDLLLAASLDPELLDELALDPRAYDHLHPVNQRPGYQFGEWDPHHLDEGGRYRRFVVRAMVMDALVEWVCRAGTAAPVKEEEGSPATGPRDSQEALVEAAAALCGTMVLAAGVSGSGPDTHSSEVTLGNLVVQIAKHRDEFYGRLLSRLEGPFGQRLREDAKRTRQPFGSIRQFLNHSMTRQRAEQLQADRLALLFATMGYGTAAIQKARSIDTPAIRLRTEIQTLITGGYLAASAGQTPAAMDQIVKAEDLLHRAIHCGALVDPWNILGFGGNFSLFPAVQNSIPDARVDQLLQIVQALFRLYAEVIKELAVTGESAALQRAIGRLRRLARWWDQYASYEVGGLMRVRGEELAGSAVFVSRVLADWRHAGSAAGNVGFWRKYADDFTTPHAYSLVVVSLLDREDYVSAMALLVHWLSQADTIPLEDDAASWHELALGWMAKVIDPDTGGDGPALAWKFLDFLEANAGEYWEVPRLDHELGVVRDEEEEGGEEPASESEGLFAAAYEGLTYRDTAADGIEGATDDGSGGQPPDTLEPIAERLLDRLHFIDTLARLWQLAMGAAGCAGREGPGTSAADAAHWEAIFRQAQRNEEALAQLADAIQAHTVPPPLGSPESVAEYTQQHATRSELLEEAIATRLETAHTVRAMRTLWDPRERGTDESGWEPLAVSLEVALRHGRIEQVRRELPKLLGALEQVPLLYVPLDRGGQAKAVFEARYAREVLRSIADDLPRLGLFRETYHLLRSALTREKMQSSSAHQVTEFSLLFPGAYRAVIERLAEALDQWDQGRDDRFAAGVMANLVGRFSRLWLKHLEGVRLSELERRPDPSDWQATVRFIQRYGRDLFTQQFMGLANLQGILHQGIEAFLDQLIEHQDPHAPIRLAQELGRVIQRQDAVAHLEFILRSVVENYAVYMDYNSSTAQSDYGENLYILLDLLRIQAAYHRQQWALHPAATAHDILARRGRLSAAVYLERALAEETSSLADRMQQALRETESRYSVRLASIDEHVGERFVKPLLLGRMLALVEPAMEEVRTGKPPEAFAQFQEYLTEYARTTSGTGMEVPHWIRQLDLEVERVAMPGEIPRPSAPRVGPSLSVEEFERQLARWDEPLP